MQKTKVAIIGRPNVGKSSLFNRISGRRMAIVAEEEGVTRDRLYIPCEAFGAVFDLIDTGGLRLDASIDYWEKIRIQTEVAVEEADILVMVVDGMVGLMDQEAEIARRLLQTKKPVFLVVNKIDNDDREVEVSQFYDL
jgi:GTPase